MAADAKHLKDAFRRAADDGRNREEPTMQADTPEGDDGRLKDNVDHRPAPPKNAPAAPGMAPRGFVGTPRTPATPPPAPTEEEAREAAHQAAREEARAKLAHQRDHGTEGSKTLNRMDFDRARGQEEHDRFQKEARARALKEDFRRQWEKNASKTGTKDHGKDP